MDKLWDEDRLAVYVDGGAIMVIAVGTYGEPLDLGEGEVEDLVEKLQAALKAVRD